MPSQTRGGGESPPPETSKETEGTTTTAAAAVAAVAAVTKAAVMADKHTVEVLVVRKHLCLLSKGTRLGSSVVHSRPMGSGCARRQLTGVSECGPWRTARVWLF